MTYFPRPEEIQRDILPMLLERGARHHIFSAISLGDPDLIRKLVEERPDALERRMSELEHGQTALHFAITRGRHDLLDLLIELGADVEAEDANRQTALEYATLRGDQTATRRLIAAGARPPRIAPAKKGHDTKTEIANSIRKGIPVLRARDIAATLRWYVSTGFSEVGRYPDDDTTVLWGMVSFGRAEVMFEPGAPEAGAATVLFVTDKIDELYDFVTSRQLRAGDVELIENLHEPVFGGLQFSVRDPNGNVLRFLQEEASEVSR